MTSGACCTLRSTSTTDRGSASDELRTLARRAAFRRALERRAWAEAAWAAARLRLEGVALDPNEELAADRAIAMLGRALRQARRRAATDVLPLRRETAVDPAARGERRSGARRRLAVAFATFALLLGGVLLALRPEDLGGLGIPAFVPRAEAAPRGGAEVALRGRFGSGVVPEEQPVAAPSPSPSPSPAPDSGPGTGPASSPGATGSPGVAGGSAPGEGGSGSASPSPKEDYARYHGRVTDAVTGEPVEGVCLVIGNETCGPLQRYTNSFGIWVVELPVGYRWRIVFTKGGFRPTEMLFYSFPGGGAAADISLRS